MKEERRETRGAGENKAELKLDLFAREEERRVSGEGTRCEMYVPSGEERRDEE